MSITETPGLWNIAATDPERVAIIDSGGATVAYGDLADRANRYGPGLQPLGLRWRIERMISALHEIRIRFGEVPQNYDELVYIAGIGPYIAGATVCFSSNQAQVLIDTNVVRVIGRIFGLSLHGEARRRKDVFQTIDAVVDRNSPRDFYYAIIDLAHTICHSKVPNCYLCPMRIICNHANCK